ncbi:MAG TPA: ATP-grasp domain-containing protein [Gaiellaceae bacterium]|nr:ATP-grasp domain-containing protein [Gaiellaceae bacterium]
MRVALIAHPPSPTSLALAARTWNGTPIEVLSPRVALLRLERGDVALVRLDVRDDLGGVEDGLSAIERLAEAGVTVLNPPAALLRAHDKVLTARTLRRAGLPHPQTRLIEQHRPPPELDFPVVVKPRFGSWGREVTLCRDRDDFERTLERLAFQSWFRATGAIAQELIPPLGHDLRLIVAGGGVIGAGRRTAAPGEWRTNVALGATVTHASPPPVALALATAAAKASGLDLVGVDLLPTGPGGFSIVELTGAVDFRPAYAVPGRNVYDDAIVALSGCPRPAVAETSAATASG